MNAIVALATPAAPAARAVIRISGTDLLAPAGASCKAALAAIGLTACAGCTFARGWHPARWVWTESTELPLELWCFPGPRSATGEDVIELHLPGNQVAARELEGRLLSLAGFRAAEPGEFTRRAFLNGKLDLTQVEAVLDLVHARDAGSARAAAAVLAGGLGKELETVRVALRDALVQIEAGLDFEEGDSQDLRPGEVSGFLNQALQALQRGAETESRDDYEESGVLRIGLIGAPNAGKSALFQWLTGSSVLISDERGTTRDRLEAPWKDWTEAGLTCLIADGPGRSHQSADARDETAQLRASKDRFAVQWWVVDSSDPEASLPSGQAGEPTVVVLTKSDAPRAVSDEVLEQARGVAECVWVSSRRDQGRLELEAATRRLVAASEERRTASARAHARHAAALREARESIEAAQALDQVGGHQDLVAEELRRALRAVGELVGELTPEELLDHVFSSFCIGK